MEISNIGGAVGARSAYKTSLDLKTEGLHGTVEIAREPKTTFSEMVKEAASESVQTIRNADVAMEQGVAGKISTQQMIEATLEAEATLSQIVGIRDKVVQAYQEVLRMPI